MGDSSEQNITTNDISDLSMAGEAWLCKVRYVQFRRGMESCGKALKILLSERISNRNKNDTLCRECRSRKINSL